MTTPIITPEERLAENRGVHAFHRLNITSNDTGQERSTKYERLGELLRKYGLDLINSEQFWAEMKRQGFGQADIDEWCDEYHRKAEAEQ